MRIVGENKRPMGDDEGRVMIVFEVELASEDLGLLCPSFVCDFCLAKIKGAGGQVLIPEVRVPAGIAIGARFQADVQVFHLHEDCPCPVRQGARRNQRRGFQLSANRPPLVPRLHPDQPRNHQRRSPPKDFPRR